MNLAAARLLQIVGTFDLKSSFEQSDGVILVDAFRNRKKLITGKYQILSKVTSKEFRLLLGSVKVFNKCRYWEDLDN